MEGEERICHAEEKRDSKTMREVREGIEGGQADFANGLP